MDFEELCRLVVEVKPSLEGLEFNSQDSLTDKLGLDSLDLLQLGRRVQKKAKVSFVTEDWLAEESGGEGARFTLASLLARIQELKQHDQ